MRGFVFNRLPMSIHISGHTGFVGRNLTKDLHAMGHHVSHIDLRKAGELIFPIEATSVIHLAGKAHDLKKVSSPASYYEINTDLTKKVFDAFLASNAVVFIFLSSVKAVADTVENILTEDTLPNPTTHYGKSKLLAEEYILSKTIPPGKRVYILRPCMIHGPGNKGNLNLLYAMVSKKIPWPLATFNNRRSFLSVENVCFIINELIIRKDITSGIYQIADDGTLSTNQLVKLIAQTLHFKPKLWYISPTLITAISKMGDKLNLPINTERLQKLTENYVVSNQKIKKALKKELPLTIEEGILKTFHSFNKSS